jgi:hypothetical protein
MSGHSEYRQITLKAGPVLLKEEGTGQDKVIPNGHEH